MLSWSTLFAPRRPSQAYVPSHAPSSTPAAYSRTRNETSSSEKELERQRKINQELQYRLENLKHDLFRTQEQLRRKNEVHAELKEKLTTLEENSRQQTTALCSKINTLENDLNAVDDEEMLREWRRCQLDIDRLVKRHFRDTAKLDDLDIIQILGMIEAMFPDAQSFLGDSKHQRWAIIQAFTVKILSDGIFFHPHAGLAEYESNLLNELDQVILGGSSLNTWRHCKSGINSALNYIKQPAHMMLVDELVYYVDHFLGAYVSTERNIWRQQMKDTFAHCVEFNRKCNEQPQTYIFSSSHPGEATDSNHMKVAGMVDCPDQPVALSLWPSLWKEVELGNYICLERELVWLTSA